MLTKPCARPGCDRLVVKRQAARLAATRYCSKTCGTQHRLDLGRHPFQHRTAEQRHRNAVKAGHTRGERAKKAKLVAVAEKVRRLMPAEWSIRFDGRDLARVVALAVRAYQEGREDGYQAGFTVKWRAARRQERVA